MNMFQNIEFLMDTNLFFAVAGNFSQILRLNTTIKISIVTKKIRIPPTMILFLKIVFLEMSLANNCLCSVLLFYAFLFVFVKYI